MFEWDLQIQPIRYLEVKACTCDEDETQWILEVHASKYDMQLRGGTCSRGIRSYLCWCFLCLGTISTFLQQKKNVLTQQRRRFEYCRVATLPETYAVVRERSHICTWNTITEKIVDMKLCDFSKTLEYESRYLVHTHVTRSNKGEGSLEPAIITALLLLLLLLLGRFHDYGRWLQFVFQKFRIRRQFRGLSQTSHLRSQCQIGNRSRN